jgi:Short C-terminal domain
MPKKHALGFTNGRIIEYEDGTAAYVPPGAFKQEFRVRIADVSGFSVTKSKKMLERTFNVHGNGTLLASTSVNHGVSEKIEKWFRSHPQFGQGTGATLTPVAAAPSGMVADELRKLAQLKEQGILSEEEFAAAKTRLLAT